MQAGAALAVNRGHPDALGLVVCLPLSDRNINRNVDLVRGDAYTVGAGSPTKAVMPQGVGFSSTDVSAYLVGTTTTSPWVTEFSVSCQIFMNSFTGSPGLWSFGGVGLAIETTGVLSLWNASSNQGLTSPSSAVATNRAHTVGVSFHAGGVQALYVDGARVAGPTSAFAFTATAEASNIGRTKQASRETCDGKIRDVRVWARVMPDATFARAHYDPLSFYRLAAPTDVSSPFLGGQFMPFLHPALQS
jgi:hypothetical protein